MIVLLAIALPPPDDPFSSTDSSSDPFWVGVTAQLCDAAPVWEFFPAPDWDTAAAV